MLYQNQRVQLGDSQPILTLDVDSEHGPLESAKGTVQRNGQTIKVEYSLAWNVWKKVQKAKKQ